MASQGSHPSRIISFGPRRAFFQERSLTLEPGKTLAHYRILRLLGRGGMGAVFLAEDIKLHRKVALKVLPPEMAANPERLERFQREARAVAALNHPHIVTLYSVEEAEGTHFLTMELVEGTSLDQALLPDGQPLERVYEIGIALADALAAAHEKGIIHRDVKPANVMITKDRVKVLDFGLAKLAPESGVEPSESHPDLSEAPTGMAALTHPGLLVGTVPYMSPEQVNGRAADMRSDIFSLGIVLYQLVTGRRPFEGGTPAETISSILRDAPRPVEETRPDAPRLLGRIIDRCLQKDPAARYQTVREARDELRGLRKEAESGAAAVPRKVSSFVAESAAPQAGRLPAQAPRERASIAVLPFDNLSGDPEQEYFADGIVEEIITGLSRIKWLFVISRNSTFLYKGKVVDVTTVGRDLGVRYVLRGSVRRSGSQVRLTGQLAEAETAAHVWADRYDGMLGDIFALQDQMTISVIGAVEPSLRKAEVERARRKRPESLDAYDLFLRALPLATTAMPEDAERALGLLQQALRLEPDYPAVHGFIAWCHEQRYLRAGLLAGDRDAALRHAQAAIQAGGDDAMALAMGGFVIGVLARDYDTALDALDRSLALSPSSAIAFGFSSIIRSLVGRYDAAMEHARMGIQLGPRDPLIYLPYIGLCYAHFFTRSFAAAASAAARASAANPRFSVPRYLHVAALVRLGRMQEARSIARVLLELQPGFTISGLVSGNITTRERMSLLAAALREAGLPE